MKNSNATNEISSELLPNLVDILHEFRIDFLRMAGVRAKAIPAFLIEHLSADECDECIKLGHAFLLSFLDNTKGPATCFCVFQTSEEKIKQWNVLCHNGLRQYEELLFGSWSYHDGKNHFIEGDVARWYIWSGMHNKLEEYATQIQEHLFPLLQIESAKELAQRTMVTIRNGSPKWKPCYMQWSYIKELDDVIKDVEVFSMKGVIEKSIEPEIAKEYSALEPQMTAWNQLRIEVVDDETIKYKVGDGGWERRNYTELGFIDKRKRLPNKLWPIFIFLATKNGSSGADSSRITPKDIDRIRKTLRQFFELQDIPIKYDSEARKYCCEFDFYDPREW